MSSKSRPTSGRDHDEKSRKAASAAEREQQHHRHHHRHHRSRHRSNSPVMTKSRRHAGAVATNSPSKNEPSNKRIATTAVAGSRSSASPRKPKPTLVNELDLLALSQKEQQAKSGNKNKDGVQDHLEKVSYRQQFQGFMDRRGYWGSRGSGYGMRHGIDYRRTPMYPPRRGGGGIGGSGDVTFQRTSYGRTITGRQLYHRNITEQKRIKDDEEKPVMNLFDPCKVPTGRSYFTHDDRATKPVRPARPKYSGPAESNGWQPLPVGWRNVRKVRRSEGDLRNDKYGSGDSAVSRKRFEKNPSDEVWKHDMFEDDSKLEEEEKN